MDKIIKTEEGKDVCGPQNLGDVEIIKAGNDVTPSSPSKEDNHTPPSYPASQWTTLFSEILSLEQPYENSDKTLIKGVRAQKMTNSNGYNTVLVDFTEYLGNQRRAFVYLKPFEIRYLIEQIDCGGWYTSKDRTLIIKKKLGQLAITVNTKRAIRTVKLTKEEIVEFKQFIPQIQQLIEPFLKKFVKN